MKHTILIALAVALSACGIGQAEIDTNTPGTTPTLEVEPSVVELAIEQLVNRLDIEQSEVEIVEIESVRWPDASLGCEMEPGKYERVVTPGYIVTLQVQDQRYEFHTDLEDRAVRCVSPAPEATEEKRTAMGNQDVQIALGDLASRLDIDESEIEVVSVEEVTWRDGSLGCPQPDRAYTQALVNGTRIVLQAEGRAWHYHSGGGREPFLCMTPQAPLTRSPDPGSGYGDY